jgi:hypothetical protein
MAGLPGIVVRVAADTAAAVKDIDRFNGALGDAATGPEKLQRGLDKLTPAATVAFGAIAAGSVVAVNAAKEQEDQLAALDAVYGEAGAAARDYAAAANELGLTQAQYAQTSALLGNSLTQLGYDTTTAAETSNQLIEASAALAAQFGGDSLATSEAITAAYRGEYDALQRYIPAINAAAVEQQALAMTGKASAAALTEQEKAAAVTALVMDGASGAIANFDEQSESAAFKTQQFQASLNDTAAALGEALLPVLTAVLDEAMVFTEWAQENPQLLQGVIVAVAALSAGIIALNVALKVYRAIQVAIRAATIAWTVVQWYLNAAMYANPVGLIILAIIALIAVIGTVIYWIAKNTDWFQRLWEWVKKVADIIKNALVSAFDWAVDKVRSLIDWVQSLIGWLRDAWDRISSIGDNIPFIGGNSAGAGVAARSAAAGVTAATTSTPTTVNISVTTGIGDPAAIARDIRRVLRDDAYRTGWAVT